MTAAPSGNNPEDRSPRPAGSRKRAVIGALFLTAVLVGTAVAVFDERRTFTAAITRMGPVPVATSFAFGLLAVGTALPVWHEVLDGLGARMPWSDSARVFFVSQLGKYL